MEDVDLGFRLRLKGYGCRLVTAATVEHVGSGLSGYRSPTATYYGQRNLVWVFAKNMPAGLIWLLLPLHVVMNAMMIVVCALRGQFGVVVHAKLDALKGLKGLPAKRTCGTNGCDRANRYDLASVEQIPGAGKLTPMRLSASIVTFRSNVALFSALVESLICALRRTRTEYPWSPTSRWSLTTRARRTLLRSNARSRRSGMRPEYVRLRVVKGHGNVGLRCGPEPRA
jgi:hypothetical protein